MRTRITLMSFVFLFFVVSLNFGEGLQLFTDSELIHKRNSKSSLLELIAEAKTNVESNPQSYDFNWQYAGVLYFYGDFYLTDKKTRKYYFNLARNYAQYAININPDGVEGYFLMGVASAMWAESNGVLQSLFMADDVARYMTKVINLDPAFYEGIPWAIRAQVYGLAPGKPISVGDRTKAYADFEQAYKYCHDYRVVYQLNVFMLTQLKQWEEAQNVLTKALAIPMDENRPREEKISFQKLQEYKKLISRNLKTKP